MAREWSPEERETYGKLRWLLVLRAAILVLCLAVVAALSGFAPVPASRYVAVLVAILAGLALDFLYWLSLAWVTQPRRAAFLQLLADCLLILFLVYLTGGVHSTFINLWFAVILGGGILVRPNFALFFASLATLCQATVSLLYYFRAAHGVVLPGLDRAWVAAMQTDFSWTLGYLLAQVTAFHLVAVLGRWLSLRLSAEKILYEEILHNLADGVVTLDRAGRIAFANPRARHLLGIKYDAEVEGRPLAECVPEANRAPLRPLIERAESRVETTLTNNYGEKGVPAELVTSLLYDERRRVRGVIGILADLTVRRKMEEAVKRADRQQAVSELAAAIAHELRNPLASIRGCVQEIRREAAISAESKEMMSIVISESDRLDGIITEFLQFARMPAARFRDAVMGPLLEEVCVLLRRHRDARGPVVLEAQPDLALRADPGQLRQMFLNLGLNALQATEDGSPVRIRARFEPLLRSVSYDDAAERENREEILGVRVEVQDKGKGIEPGNFGSLFRPFYTTKPKGTGMGLAIVNRIVESHHGHVHFSSEPGKGTTFSVWLPRDPEGVAGVRLSGIDAEGEPA